ncbi:MAG: YqiA/YcfP family alpha/beta fold hydrolase [Promethearchaeota archaeon]
MKILYLHGSNSAGFGSKVNYLREAFGAENVIALNCPHDPAKAIQLLEFLVKNLKKTKDFYLFGSSQGGYFAIYLSYKYRVPAILVNPQTKAGEPPKEIGKEVENFKTGEKYIYKEEYYEFLKKIELKRENIEKIKDKLFIYLDEDDDVINGKETAKYFEGFYVRLYPGGDHFFQHMENLIDDLKNNLKLK